MGPPDEFLEVLEKECKKLEVIIDVTSIDPGMTAHEIVETYYQVTSVSAMISVFREQLDANEHKPILKDIEKIERLISEKFITDIHPKILSLLTDTIQVMTKNLQSGSGGMSKEDIENESKYYEELRKFMSAKEFIDQCCQELSID